MTTVGFATLGCRVNQYDTDSMRGLFLAAGYVEQPFDAVNDVYVINTCSVTQMSEKKSRQIIRRARKLNDHAIIAVTGCYAQLAPDVIAAIEGVDVIIGTNEKHRIVPIVEEVRQGSQPDVVTMVNDVMAYDDFEEISLYPSAVEHTRADLKIQEGCNNYCSYCIIPYTRGAFEIAANR